MIKTQKTEKMMSYKNIQKLSICSRPLTKDPTSGGAEMDGSKSKIYDKHCYENGEINIMLFNACL
jgi:hypothetical protein